MKKISIKTGVTMIELIVAIAITSIIGTGALMLHQNSVKIASAGMANVEMMREGKLILETIREDLKHACVPYKESFSISFDNIVQVEFSKNKGLEGAEFSFLRFKNKPDFAVMGYYEKDYMLRALTKITYRLEKIEDSELLKLVRETAEHKGETTVATLTERLNFFNIKPVEIKTETADRWLWNISLQLSHKSDKSSVVLRGENCLSFYDLVFSEFYQSVSLFPDSPRNWNTGMTFSPK